MTRAKTDCFAYKPGQQKPPRRKAECTALDKLYCRDGECRFYKAAELIRAQAEQIHETPAEYIARKYGIGGDADGQDNDKRE